MTGLASLDEDNPVRNERGARGEICEIDEEGDKLIKFVSAGEQWFGSGENLKLSKEVQPVVVVGTSVVFMDDVDATRDEPLTITKGVVGILLETEEEGDMLIEFKHAWSALDSLWVSGEYNAKLARRHHRAPWLRRAPRWSRSVC